MTHSLLSKGLFSRYQTPTNRNDVSENSEMNIFRFKNLDQVFSQNLDQKYGNRIINLDVFAYGMISSCMDIVYKLAYVLNAWCQSHYVNVMFVLKLCCRINWRRKLQHIVRHINKKLVKFRNGSTSC